MQIIMKDSTPKSPAEWKETARWCNGSKERWHVARMRAVNKPDFSNQDLRGISLRGFWLDGASFRGANLSGCNIENGSAVDADFTGADMSGVKGYDCVMRPGALDFAASVVGMQAGPRPKPYIDRLEAAASNPHIEHDVPRLKL